MSYDIYIGNAELQYDEYSTHATVNGMRHDDAPVFPNDELTDQGNSRHPSYSGWSEFCEKAGLTDLFFGEEGLMASHPGTEPITKDHAEIVDNALHAWKATHPGAKPGFDAFDKSFRVTPTGLDGVLARLIWLSWWMHYALDNCERPAIHNH